MTMVRFDYDSDISLRPALGWAISSSSRGLAIVAVGLLCVLGCSKEPKPSTDARAPTPMTPEPPVPATAAAVAEAPSEAIEAQPAEPSAAQAKISEDSFDVELKGSGEYRVDQPAQVEIVLDAKAPFKVNAEYPYSFAPKPAEGVEFASMKVTKDQVKLEEKRATMPVKFTPKQAGSRAIAGTFKFSVCTEEQCLIKKHELSLAIAVK